MFYLNVGKLQKFLVLCLGINPKIFKAYFKEKQILLKTRTTLKFRKKKIRKAIHLERVTEKTKI